MGRSNVLFNSFVSGLLGSKLKGRVDLNQYASGCKTLTNMVVMPQGGATRRPGFKYIATTKTLGGTVRLIPFKFSETVAYIIEFGAGYFRFYKDGAQITSGGSAYEVVNTYTAAQLFEVTYTQSADVLYLFHPSHHPKRLSRFSDTQWAFTDIPFEDGPYNDVNTSDITIDHGDMSGVRTNLYGVAGGLTKIAAGGVPFFKANSVQGNMQYLTPGTSVYEWTKGGGKLGQKAYFSVRFFTTSTWAAVGFGGALVISTDGETWEAKTSGASTRLNDIAYGAIYVMVGAGGIIKTLNSSWAGGTTPVTSDATTNDLYGVCYGGSQFVVVGEGGKIYTDADGLATFTLRTSGTTKNLYSVCYGSSLYVAVGEDGTLLTSTNGTTWTARTSGVNGDLKSVIFDGSYYIAVGAKGYIITSVDGVTWTVRNYNPDITLYAVTYLTVGTTKHRVAVGTNGMIAYSPDYVNWVYRSVQTATITATGDVFDSVNDVGRMIRLSGKGVWSWGKILVVDDAATARIEVRTRIYGEKPTGEWQLGTFYAGNYPKCGCFYEQRLMMAGTVNEPCTVWGSCTSDYTNFAPTTISAGTYEVETNTGKKKVKEDKKLPGEILDSSAIAYTIYGTTIHTIKWMLPTKVLLIGTISGIKKMSGSSPDASLTPFNVVVSDQSAYGTADIMPVKVGYSALFVPRIAKKLREIHYQFEVDQLVTPDVTIMCEEITGTGIVDMTFQQEPYNIIWCVTSDGDMVGLTYDAEQKVVGWHKHTTSGTIESIACIPGTTEDEVWIVVRRAELGIYDRFIEKLAPFNISSILTSSRFLDSYVDSASVVATGLTHLNGVLCQVLLDGVDSSEGTPSGGQLILDNGPSTIAVIGVGYTSELSTMNIASPPSMGQMKRLGNVVVSLYETGEGVEIGYDSTHYDEMSAVKLPSGSLTTIDHIMSVPKGLEREQYVYVRQDRPLPLTVLYAAVEVLSNER